MHTANVQPDAHNAAGPAQTAPGITIERYYTPDPQRQAAALLVLLARRAVEEAAAADEPEPPAQERPS
jgi:hypothetical protein